MKKDWFFCTTLFLIWQVLLFFVVGIGDLVLTYRPGFEYVHIWKFVAPYPPVSSVFFYPWANFDGVHYLLIASQGYTNNFGFFPLFPALIHLISLIFGKGSVFGLQQFFSALVISNISIALALFLFYQLLLLDYGQSIARRTLVFLLLFPTSFFFGAIYSESLFFLLLIASFYCARKQKWLLSSVFGTLLTLTRSIGICVLPALLYEAWKQKAINLKTVLSFLMIPWTFFGYAFFNWVATKNPLYFLEAHGNLANGRSVDTVVLIPQTIFRYIKIFLTLPISQFEWWIALLELVTFVFVSILLYFAWRRRVRKSYLLFSLFAFLIPASSGTFTGIPRYSLVLFPIFISLTLVKNRSIRLAYLIISPILLFLLLMFFSKGYYVS